MIGSLEPHPHFTRMQRWLYQMFYYRPNLRELDESTFDRWDSTSGTAYHVSSISDKSPVNLIARPGAQKLEDYARKHCLPMPDWVKAMPRQALVERKQGRAGLCPLPGADHAMLMEEVDIFPFLEFVGLLAVNTSVRVEVLISSEHAHSIMDTIGCKRLKGK